jgi:hypothetical protein
VRNDYLQRTMVNSLPYKKLSMSYADVSDYDLVRALPMDAIQNKHLGKITANLLSPRMASYIA